MISKALKIFFNQQQECWELMRNNYLLLKNIQTKFFEFDGFVIKIQFNPERIRSTASKTDKKSLESRPCFLCLHHLPDEQLQFTYNEDFLILTNPYPIFSEHYTISSRVHQYQQIEPFIHTFLELGKDFQSYTVFYNGPSSGASAPDHLHFQAGNKGLMPLDEELLSILKSKGKLIFETLEFSITIISGYLRKFICLSAKEISVVMAILKQIIDLIKDIEMTRDEPQMNIFCYYMENEWKIVIFPREKLRPWQYFEQGERNILLSPASVELGGVLVTPLEKDFVKITKEDIIDIFDQVCISADKFELLCKKIKEKITLTTLRQ